jgi:hypothetical protein
MPRWYKVQARVRRRILRAFSGRESRARTSARRWSHGTTVVGSPWMPRDASPPMAGTGLSDYCAIVPCRPWSCGQCLLLDAVPSLARRSGAFPYGRQRNVRLPACAVSRLRFFYRSIAEDLVPQKRLANAVKDARRGGPYGNAQERSSGRHRIAGRYSRRGVPRAVSCLRSRGDRLRRARSVRCGRAARAGW